MQNPSSLLCDFYEFTLANGCYKSGKYNQSVNLDLFFKKTPNGSNYAVFAGLEDIVRYIENLKFSRDDIAYLRKKKVFDEYFLDYLSNFRFTGDIYCLPEGTPVLKNETVMSVKSSAIEAQLIETFLLLTVNNQSLIATKANRIVRAASGKPVLEIETQMGQGRDIAISGRAAYIGGCSATSCTLTNQLYGVPLSDTMSNSWVQMFDDEYEAFKCFCEMYPQNAVLLIDTYDTLKSGLPNAIRAFKEILLPKGVTDFFVRLGSSDVSALSKQVRQKLDEAGLQNCKIIASYSMDEDSISNLIADNAKVDVFGVEERIIDDKNSPVFTSIYKNGQGDKSQSLKNAYQYIGKSAHRTLSEQGSIFDGWIDDYKNSARTDIKRQSLIPIFLNGQGVYKLPPLTKVRDYCLNGVNNLLNNVG